MEDPQKSSKGNVEMRRLNSYELNLNKEEEKILENEDILNKRDLLSAEQNSSSHLPL